jgi:hypothetical protein
MRARSLIGVSRLRQRARFFACSQSHNYTCAEPAWAANHHKPELDQFEWVPVRAKKDRRADTGHELTVIDMSAEGPLLCLTLPSQAQRVDYLRQSVRPQRKGLVVLGAMVFCRRFRFGSSVTGKGTGGGGQINGGYFDRVYHFKQQTNRYVDQHEFN